MVRARKVHGGHQQMIENKSRFGNGIDSASEPEEDDGFQIRISGGRLGNTISLSYLQRIPKKEDGTRSSHGSQGHPDKCTPCCFFMRARGCADGMLCSMCHDSHPTECYSRRKKQRLRKAMKGGECNKLINPEELVQSQSASASEGEVLMVYIKNTFLEACISYGSRSQASVRSRSSP